MFATVDHLIMTYGGPAIFLGAGLEGEAAVTAGGLLAYHHLVHPVMAAICAFAGSFVADQFVFAIGRFQRNSSYVQRARQRQRFDWALRFLEHYPVVFCIVFRFIYGLRIIGPLAIGISQIRAKQFFALNAVSAAVWACIFTFIGYEFGGAFEAVLSRIFAARLIAPMAVFLVLLVIFAVLARRSHTDRLSE